MKIRTLLFTFLLTLPMLQAQDRYLDEVFDSVVVIREMLYGVNITVITGAPAADSLHVDVYMPAGDTLTERPVAVVLHSGTFLPPGFASTIGNRHDYANVETCKRLAKRGYVAINMDYRVGWNPISPEEIVRRATIIQAAYRAIQDVYSCVRFLNKTVDDFGNPYGLDMDKVCIYGIGTGGFVGFNLVALDDWRNEIFIDKFRLPIPPFTPFIDTVLYGDIYNTKEGVINIPLHVGYKQDIHFSFGVDGGLGDSSWLDPDNQVVPMVLGGLVKHPTTPFGIDPLTNEINCDMPVFAGAGTNIFVVNIAGSACMTRKANELGMNAALEVSDWNDDVSNAIRTHEFAQEHLWPIRLPGDDTLAQTGPWEYWDSTFWKTIPHPNPAFDNFHEAGLATNPDMSMEKANRYIDTSLWFFAPRACLALGLSSCIESSVENLNEAEFDFTIAPNPTSGEVRISIKGNELMTKIVVFDMLGKMVKSYDNLYDQSYVFDVSDLTPGMYGIRAEVGKRGYLSSKIIVQH
jgi:Secretion system C-terminal sorting domain/BD-FAE